MLSRAFPPLAWLPPRLPLTLGLIFTALTSLLADPNELQLFEQEEKSLSEALQKAPQAIRMLSRRGDMRQFLGRFPEAIADYEEMIRIDPSQDAPHWRLGIAYYFAGAYAKSAQQFEKYHAYDGRDRENGIWKFMAQAKNEGVQAARAHMLQYPPADREPFPALYEMFAGKRTPAEVLEAYAPLSQQSPTVRFFAGYYVGVFKSLVGQSKDGLPHIEEAVRLFSPGTAAQSGGPGYMWQIARLHAAHLRSQPPSSSIPSVPQP